jgi:S-formylglutathione hydrolase FrmB
MPALICFLLCACSVAQVTAPKPAARLREGEFFSDSLQRSMKYRVLVPSSYDSGNRRYPVLYLLHGLYGSYENWTKLTHLEEYSSVDDFIIAMPDANDSWYTNWYLDRQNKFEDYIVRDFLPEFERRYRTIADREDRVIAGLSMGGYGALKIGLKYPQLFRMVGSFSGALNAASGLAGQRLEFADQLNKVYGPPDSPTRNQNDLFQIAEESSPQSAPYLYLDCGTADFFVVTNREFTSLLRSRKFAYEYHELPGDHNWDYWDARIRYFLHELRRERISDLHLPDAASRGSATRTTFGK